MSAPPELPGLIAASVWMKSSYVGEAQVRAAGRADDPGRDGLTELKGAADREHPFADLQRARIAPRHVGSPLASTFRQRDIGGGIGADHLCRQLALVRKRHGDLAHVLADDVVVRDDVAVRRDDRRRTRG